MKYNNINRCRIQIGALGRVNIHTYDSVPSRCIAVCTVLEYEKAGRNMGPGTGGH